MYYPKMFILPQSLHFIILIYLRRKILISTHFLHTLLKFREGNAPFVESGFVGDDGFWEDLVDDDDFGRGGGAYGEVDEVGGVEGGVEDLGVLVGFELIRHMQWHPPPRITRNNIPQPPPHYRTQIKHPISLL